MGVILFMTYDPVSQYAYEEIGRFSNLDWECATNDYNKQGGQLLKKAYLYFYDDTFPNCLDREDWGACGEENCSEPPICDRFWYEEMRSNNNSEYAHCQRNPESDPSCQELIQQYDDCRAYLDSVAEEPDEAWRPFQDQYEWSNWLMWHQERAEEEGGVATNAILGRPEDIAVDSVGNVYVVEGGIDSDTSRIRKIETVGNISTVMGKVFSPEGCMFDGIDMSGDGGLATDALFCVGGHHISLDSADNLLVTDQLYFELLGYSEKQLRSVIRKVSPAGITSTVAGGGTNSDWAENGDWANMVAASFGDIATDQAGNIYFTSFNTNGFRFPTVGMIDSVGFVTHIAGGNSDSSVNGGAASVVRLSGLESVSVGGGGSLYLADAIGVKKVSPSTFTYVAGAKTFIDAQAGQIYNMSASGLHLNTLDSDTGVMLEEFTYNDDGKLISIADQFGNTTSIERDGNGVPIAIVSADGLRTELIITVDNQLTEIRYPDDSSYGFEYTVGGLMLAETEPEGNRFEHLFDATGLLTEVIDEDGGQWHYSESNTFDGGRVVEKLTAEGNLTSYRTVTDLRGFTTSVITKTTGALTQTIQSADGFSSENTLSCGTVILDRAAINSNYGYKYLKETSTTTPAGLVNITERSKFSKDTDDDKIFDLFTEELKQNNKLTTVVHDTLQSQQVVTSPEGRTVTMEYDPETLRIQSLNIPGLYETVYNYDSKGRLVNEQTDTAVSSYVYNASGFLASVTDPAGDILSYRYDQVGRVIEVKRSNGATTAFTYDRNGNMILLTNPLNRSHSFSFNEVNKKTSQGTPISGSYNYLYDKDRHLIQVTLPSNKKFENIYENGNLVQIQTPGGNIDYSYEYGSKIAAVTMGANSIAYDYDGILLTGESISGDLAGELIYTYNNDFNLSSFSYAGLTTEYLYDNDGLLTGSGPYSINRNSANGLPEGITGGGLNLVRGFDGFGDVVNTQYTIAEEDSFSWNLVRDITGRISSKTEYVKGIPTQLDYTYDSLGQLLTVRSNGATLEEYRYDANGRRTYEFNSLKSIAGRTYNYTEEDHLLSTGDAIYTYDVDGFLLSKSVGSEKSAYNYSSRGELLSVNLPDGRVITYSNDPLGRRIVKMVDGIVAEKYLWQGTSRLLTTYDGNNNLLARFAYADDRMPVSMELAGVTYYLNYDQVGSLRQVVDSSGSVVKRIDYDTFGDILTDTNPDFRVPFGFAGGLLDTDTSLLRFGARDYDSDIGRWVSKDPIGFAGGDMNLYGYCLSDPVNFVDPEGKFVITTAIATTMVVGAIVGAWQGGKNGVRSGVVGATVGLIPYGGVVLGPIAGQMTGRYMKKKSLCSNEALVEYVAAVGANKVPGLNDLITTFIKGANNGGRYLQKGLRPKQEMGSEYGIEILGGLK